MAGLSRVEWRAANPKLLFAAQSFFFLYIYTYISAAHIYMSKSIHDRFAAHFRGTTFHPSRRHHFRFKTALALSLYRRAQQNP